MHLRAAAWLLGPGLLVAVVAVMNGPPPRPAEAAPAAAPAAAAPAPRGSQTSPDRLALGRTTYQQQCAPCHGADGRGEGEAAYLLYPKPRDFTAGRYLMVSTWERVPTDQDLFDSISRGIPGSAMPSWGHLPEETLWGLVAYIKSLAGQPWEIAPATEAAEGGRGTGVIAVPAEPPYDAAARARAIELFTEACAPCHGATGRGDGVQEQFDDKGYPTRPRDLTLGVFKGEPAPANVYRRVIAGMPGSPMPMSDWAYGQDAWHLVHLVRSWSSDRQRERVEMKRFTIDAPRVEVLPEHPDSGGWALARPVNLHLMPLWWRSDRPEEVTVQAVHDGTSLALRLTWSDATDDHTAMRVQDFRDAVAVEFSLTPDPPFFAMGATGQFVNIWMWKSERQADLLVAFQDLDEVYPNIGIDSYPDFTRSPLEQPARQALTLQSDPTYVTGWGAGNIVSDPTRRSASEDLSAQGFGTLRARPGSPQEVLGKGVYDQGTYRVMFRRALKDPGTNAVQLKPGTLVPVAFAVWNGRAGDRDGKKSVTIWQELKLAP